MAPVKASNGVLPVPVTAIKKPAMAAPPPSKPSSNVSSARLRLIIRRLPPGLTQTEFEAALGEEWKISAGKVDWSAYKEGKISKDPSKPSRPGRAYIKVKDPSYIDVLNNQVRQTTFQDMKNTTKDPCLLAPPAVEFAPYQRVPGSRMRKDGRQGTIDQDPEFIDFLQSLTEPVTKALNADTDGADAKQDKVTITPLVQFIKDKKANKAKEEPAKASKAQPKEAKAEKPEQKKVSVIKKDPPSAAEKARREKATQDAVKAINSSVASMGGKAGPSKTEAQPPPAAKETGPNTPSSAKKERERGNASVAAKILQRDLGLGPKERRTPRASKSAVVSPEASKATLTTTPKVVHPLSSSSDTRNTPSLSDVQIPNQAASTPAAPPTGPRTVQSPTPTPSPAQSAAKPPSRPPRPSPQPSPGAKSAFLKHANPSQGITEPLLLGAFSAFGNVTKCEIDKKKGFGYVDFDDTEGLRKAMQAIPVKVGNGQVVVLENKARIPTIRNGPVLGRLPVHHAQPQIQQNQSQPANPAQKIEVQGTPDEAQAPTQTASEEAAPATLAPALTTTTTTSSPPPTPTAPPSAPRSVPANVRGRGGHIGRGNFGPPNRGGRGGGFRGGRGPFRGHPPRGGGPGGAGATPSVNPPPGQPATPTAPNSTAPATGDGGGGG